MSNNNTLDKYFITPQGRRYKWSLSSTENHEEETNCINVIMASTSRTGGNVENIESVPAKLLDEKLDVLATKNDALEPKEVVCGLCVEIVELKREIEKLSGEIEKLSEENCLLIRIVPNLED